MSRGNEKGPEKEHGVEPPENLIWIDCEMTGLQIEQDYLLEIATIVTNIHLKVLAEGPVFAIHQPDSILNQMGEWVKDQHTRSGLVERVKSSTVTEAQAETATIEFLSAYVQPGKSPMCGNSVYQDRRFLYRYMPRLERYFHYRLLDVSSIKILAQCWAPPIAEKVKKKSLHLALQDIRDSIDELRCYREYFFKLEGEKS